MVDPLTAIAVIGTGAKLLGGGKKAKSERKAGRANAKVHEENAAIRRIMAKDATQRGDVSEGQHRMKVAGLKSDQKAAMMAGGTTMTGSNSRILDDTDLYGELDALTIRRNAGMEAWGLNKQADIDMMNADAAKQGGAAAANNTILTTAAQVGSTWGSYYANS